MPRTIPLEERFEMHSRWDGTCRRWTGSHSKDGYGQIKIGGRSGWVRRVHRVAYEHYVGPIAEGYTIDHVEGKGCRFRDCFNPEHLEQVTHAENCRRGHAGWQLAERTHCKNGHSFAEYGKDLFYPDGRFRKRQCEECRRERKRAARAAAAAVRPPRERKTHCIHGHSFAEHGAATYYPDGRFKQWQCRICMRDRSAKAERRRKRGR